MEFKEKIKELRKSHGISQEVLARELLTSRSTIAKWESGIRLPTAQSLDLIAKYFNITVDELLDNRDTKSLIVQTGNSLQKIFWGILCLFSLLYSIIVSLLYFFKIYGTNCVDFLGILSGTGYIYITYSLADMSNNPWWIVSLSFNILFSIVAVAVFFYLWLSQLLPFYRVDLWWMHGYMNIY